MEQSTIVVVIAALIGAGGVSGIITGIVAWRNSDVARVDANWTRIDKVVAAQRELLDEYRQEAAKDESRMQTLEAKCDRLEVQLTEQKEGHEECQRQLTAVRQELHSMQRNVSALEAQVIGLGGSLA